MLLANDIPGTRVQVRGLVQDALDKGATALVGGDQGSATADDGSCFVRPVVLAGCDMSMGVCATEASGQEEGTACVIQPTNLKRMKPRHALCITFEQDT
jgi:Aldehyde dehydrogenase family